MKVPLCAYLYTLRTCCTILKGLPKWLLFVRRNNFIPKSVTLPKFID